MRMHVIRGLLLYFLITSPWYYAMYTVHGMEFINTFLGFHNVTRFTTPEHANRVTFWYYFPVIILGMFPWTGILLQSIKESLFGSRIDDMRQLLFYHIWWGFVFIFFTLCQTKLVSYILPMFPPLAIIIGWNISRMLTKFRHNTTFYSWMAGGGIMFLLFRHRLDGWRPIFTRSILQSDYARLFDFTLRLCGYLYAVVLSGY